MSTDKSQVFDKATKLFLVACSVLFVFIIAILIVHRLSQEKVSHTRDDESQLEDDNYLILHAIISTEKQIIGVNIENSEKLILAETTGTIGKYAYSSNADTLVYTELLQTSDTDSEIVSVILFDRITSQKTTIVSSDNLQKKYTETDPGQSINGETTMPARIYDIWVSEDGDEVLIACNTGIQRYTKEKNALETLLTADSFPEAKSCGESFYSRGFSKNASYVAIEISDTYRECTSKYIVNISSGKTVKTLDTNREETTEDFLWWIGDSYYIVWHLTDPVGWHAETKIYVQNVGFSEKLILTGNRDEFENEIIAPSSRKILHFDRHVQYGQDLTASKIQLHVFADDQLNSLGTIEIDAEYRDSERFDWSEYIGLLMSTRQSDGYIVYHIPDISDPTNKAIVFETESFITNIGWVE